MPLLPPMPNLHPRLLRSDLDGYKAASNLAFNNEVKKLIAGGRRIFHFGFGESPFPVPEPFRQGLVDSADHNEYLSVEGLPSLRQEILAFHRRHGDFEHFEIEDFVLGAGSKEIIYHTMNVFGGEVMLVSPSWTSYFPQTQLTGRSALVVETSYENRFVPTAADIERAIAFGEQDAPKLLVLNSPNNPSGVTYSEQQIREIAEVCRKHKILVLSDEIYARLTPAKFTSIAKFYPEGTIVSSGFSKWASLGGWRAGYALFPKELAALREAVASAGSHSYTCQPAPVQHALVKGMQHAHALDLYIAKCQKVLSFVGSYAHRQLADVGVRGHAPDGTYYFMPDFEVCRCEHKIRSGQELSDLLLAEANVAIQPCDPHYLRPQGELSMRFAFVNFDGKLALSKVEAERPYAREEQEQFLRDFCPEVVEGVRAVVAFVQKHRN